MTKYELPEHTVHKDATAVVLVFADPLTADDATLVHRHLRAIHPGAGIATTGDRQVTVTPIGATRPRTARKAT